MTDISWKCLEFVNFHCGPTAEIYCILYAVKIILKFTFYFLILILQLQLRYVLFYYLVFKIYVIIITVL